MNELNTNELRSGCYRVAKQFEERAAKADSTPDDQEAAELAARVIKRAERLAGTIPEDWADADLSAFHQTVTSLANAFQQDVLSAAPTAAEALQTDALAELAKEERRFMQSLNLRAWDVWNEANELLADLLTLYPLRSN
ncbi:hypothetical protein [Nitrospira moscoviensis]|uniref:Uncharacterized protein n=1 Tax=Nitrospira moscoviensis TaxID=42253 RepID=A0A0K2GH58_NITMO|nr:hypothetical protein [Nitrospira moscoviensis]ALA60189.1 hypothetical protein NITMOv2_3799 [Nitrospira moscoviensis]